MKYFLRVLFVLVVATGVVTGMYYYTAGGSTAGQDKDAVSLTTVTKPPATEKNSNRVLLASLEKEKFYLYKGDRGIVLVHGDKEFQFYNWNSAMIDEESPNLYYADFDGDDTKELIIRAVDGVNDSTKSYIYCLYILDPVIDDKGNESYDVTLADKEDWATIFSDQIKLEVSQLKKCNKFVQFAMDLRSKSIKYDRETGLAQSGHTGYARALSSGGKYLEVDQMTKENGIYTIDKDNKINVDVDIDVSYKGTGVTQRIGTIHFQLTLNNSKLYVTNRSMYFTANKDYKICDPNIAASSAWSYTENNSNKSAVTGNGVVDWLKCETSFDPSVSTQTVTYANNNTDIDHIASVTITESYVQLVAKQNCTFDANAIKNGDYSVIINAGTDNEYDIAYNTEVNGNILKINFDKTYSNDEIDELIINFGAK